MLQSQVWCLWCGFGVPEGEEWARSLTDSPSRYQPTGSVTAPSVKVRVRKKLTITKKLYKRFLMIYSRCSVPFSCGFRSLSEQLSWAALVGLQMSAGRPEGSASLLHSYHPGNRYKHNITYYFQNLLFQHVTSIYFYQPSICMILAWICNQTNQT